MPIPTDTFWNVKKLNVVFMLSAVALVAMTIGSILQDYGLLENGTDWRTQQRAARAWDAALTVDKIDATSTPEKKQQLAKLDADIADAQKQVDAKRDRIASIEGQIKRMESDR